jgi:hypothetical protein
LKKILETLGCYIVETNNPHLIHKHLDSEVSEFLQWEGVLFDERLVAGQMSLRVRWFEARQGSTYR